MEHAWRDASIATGLISSVPTLVLPFIPQSATRNGSGLQRILLCFAVGGMMGDVFLHLLPHLLMGGHHSHGGDTDVHDHHHDHGHDHHHHGSDDSSHHGHDAHDDTLLSSQNGGEGGHMHGIADLLLPLLVLGGFMVFFVSERIVRALVGGEGGHAHHHSHSHGSSNSNNSSSKKSSVIVERNGDDDVGRRKKNDDHASAVSAEKVEADQSNPSTNKGRGSLKIAGILNLAADALHNLSDGIAIGAAFASGSGLGYSTALATLLHELPHEIGDFAVLVQSGMGKWQAIGAQFATALAAFAGTAIGLLATSYAGLEQPLLAATAGGFVYVSCVGVMPGILEGSPSLLQGLGEVTAMCTGIALMAVVALLE